MYDSILLELFKHRFASIAEEMGMVLRRTAYSPNIKERLDFSCAIFNATGQMIAQAAHIPVHLGAMPISVATAIKQIEFAPGDVVILNDPFQGGSHLPDLTMITPIYIPHIETKSGSTLFGFVASRAHHADVGGMTPGSMPLSTEIYQEGLIIPPLKLVEQGQLNQSIQQLILANVRTPEERAGDLRAQIAANSKGVTRLQGLIAQHGQAEVSHYMTGLLDYAERMTRRLINQLPDGEYQFEDVLDNDGVTYEPIPIAVTITIAGETATVDFSRSAKQVPGSVNAVYAVTLSAVLYVFRALIGLDIPANSGCLVPLTVIAPAGSIVNANRPAAVAGGNVETSQRIVDVLLGALAQAAPDLVPAASQGSMNNLTIGGWNPEMGKPFTYYETMGGGLGATASADGASATQCHMTNTLNTPVEALEYAYPFRVTRYEVRRNSGGQGAHQGGDGIRREMELLTDAQVTLLTERRTRAPYGLEGGEAGQMGRNMLIRGKEQTELPSKVSLHLQAGDILQIETPGGGGHGEAQES
ncbi:hydantoinase B/oxoprolinase family protein [Anaerolineales bacterium HSG6]|nr:hydantoinase B/oxoprolinase family protein [Anaerolineales bacterium HSG6]